MAKEKDEEKNKVKNYANNYKPYWETDKNADEKRKAPDRPEFRLFISHQKMGTETSAVPYEGQPKISIEGKDTTESKTS